MARVRTLRSGSLAQFVTFLTVAAGLFHLLTIGLGLLEPRLQRAVHFLFMLPLAFILYPATNKSPKDRPSRIDGLLALSAVAVNLYVIVNVDRVQARWEGITPVSTEEVLMGCVAILLCLEAVRRSAAFALAVVAVCFLVYLYWSAVSFGSSQHTQQAGAHFARLVETMYLYQSEGIYGNLLGVSATYIALFVLFGASIERTQAGQFFMNLARLLVGRTRGGPAKMSVMSSALFGTIMGQGTANVYTTGSLTIPLMKKSGFRDHFAGGVEAVSSMGGALLPPVMGTAAFVMIDALGIPLLTLMKRAVLPALFYFLGIFLVVHFVSAKQNVGSLSLQDIPDWKVVMRKAYLLLPIVVLTIILILGFSALKAGLVALVLAIILSIVECEGKREAPRIILDVLSTGARNTVMIAVSCATAGMIVAAIVYSGLPVTFGTQLVSLTGAYLPVLLIATMLVGLVLGLGLPATPAYILTSALLVPSLATQGVDLIQAHLFVFYFAILACITPPVCLCSYAAAGIADADPIKTGFQGLRIGFAGFLVPFVFMYRPALSLQGSWPSIIATVVVCVIVVTAAASGLTGWFGGPLKIWERCLLLAGAIILVGPSAPYLAAGGSAVGGALILTRARRALSKRGLKRSVIS